MRRQAHFTGPHYSTTSNKSRPSTGSTWEAPAAHLANTAQPHPGSLELEVGLIPTSAPLIRKLSRNDLFLIFFGPAIETRLGSAVRRVAHAALQLQCRSALGRVLNGTPASSGQGVWVVFLPDLNWKNWLSGRTVNPWLATKRLGVWVKQIERW